MLVQKVTSYRFRQRGWFVATLFHDASNAFFSLKTSQVVSDTAPPFTDDTRDHELISNRLQRAHLTFTDPNSTTMSIAQGVLPGDHAGPIFSTTPTTARWRTRLRYTGAALSTANGSWGSAASQMR